MILHKIWAKMLKKNYQAMRTISCSKKWAKYILSKIEPDTDVIFSLSTIPVACLDTKIPIYIYIDGIYEYMLTQGFKKVLNNIKVAHQIEEMALKRCTKVITSSNASAEVILKHYPISPQKVEIVPLGANWDVYPSQKDVMDNIYRKSFDKCRILFVGVSWERKGAQLVIDTVNLLHDQEFPIELHLVGLREIPIILPSYIVNHGFISKMTSGGLEKLVSLYRDSHFLFVPSYAEAYGLVFCEASGYGLPSISHAVGGIKTIVENGVNGELFEVGTQPKVFAQYIKDMFINIEEYKELSTRTYKRFSERLNWKESGRKIVEIINTSL
jgi:glycosyltransferase involved in cell wall biosynthesis